MKNNEIHKYVLDNTYEPGTSITQRFNSTCNMDSFMVYDTGGNAVKVSSSNIIKDNVVEENAADNGSKENGLNGTNTDGTAAQGDLSNGQDPEDLASPFGNKDITELEGHRVSIDENGRAELQMFIPADIDNFEKYGDGYILKEDADFTSYGWVVDGACNTKADWTDIIKKGKSKENINVHITYQMRALTEEEAAGMGDEVVFNL